LIIHPKIQKNGRNEKFRGKYEEEEKKPIEKKKKKVLTFF
jgi:hypothetical protein